MKSVGCYEWFCKWNRDLFRAGILAIVIVALWGALPTRAQRPNVLFIAVDDLRPMLGCYGDRNIRTPHIDRLAARGTIFGRAYCQAPQCAPSRTSLLTGLRPGTSGVYSSRHPFDRKRHPGMVTLPEQFKKHGYHTQSFGKIFHDASDFPASWSVPSSPGRPREMWETVDEETTAGVPYAERAGIATRIRPRKDCVAIQAPDVPDETLYAGRMTSQAIQAIGQMKDRPFFLSVGYRRPHLPLVAPRQYFDLYPTSTIVLPVHRQAPARAPLWSIYNTVTYWHPHAREVWGKDVDIPKYPESLAQALDFAGWELRSYRGIPGRGRLSDSLQKKVWQAYMACISYVDAQVGRLIEAIHANGLSERTIIVLWSDHGWHLGEHGTWAKMTLFEWANRIPLVLAAPQPFPSRHVDSLVELIDVYPTLCELAGLSCPAHVEGNSLLPLLRNPYRPWKTAAFSEFPRHGHSLGRSIRTDDYRYTEWVDAGGNVLDRELYEHPIDPYELVNMVDTPSRAETARQLSEQLQAGWQAARPR